LGKWNGKNAALANMIFLVLQIAFMSSFALQIKYHQESGRDLLSVGAINYFFAALAAGVWVIHKGEFGISNATWITGALCGVAYVISYLFLMRTVKSSGLSVTWSVVRLSVLIPVLFSIFYWKEQPSVYQIGGIISVCVSLPLLSIKPGNSGNNRILSRISPMITALFFTTGGSGLTAKAFSEFSPAEQRQMYLLFLFGTTAVMSIFLLAIRRLLPRVSDIPFGIALGASNLLAGHFLLLSLNRLPGMLVFPVSGSVGIVLTTLAGVAIWREKLRGFTILGIIAAAIAVILINLK
jgi:multidrug transporter EmrE-like cation transporter